MYYVRMFLLLLCLNGADIVAGIIAAIRQRDIESSRLRDGLFKKAGFIFCYMLAFIVDEYSAVVGIDLGVQICPAVAVYVFGTEMVSIIENIGRINPDLIPDKLLGMFHVKHFIDDADKHN